MKASVMRTMGRILSEEIITSGTVRRSHLTRRKKTTTGIQMEKVEKSGPTCGIGETS
jgi:hypothetical protein